MTLLILLVYASIMLSILSFRTAAGWVTVELIEPIGDPYQPDLDIETSRYRKYCVQNDQVK